MSHAGHVDDDVQTWIQVHAARLLPAVEAQPHAQPAPHIDTKATRRQRGRQRRAAAEEAEPPAPEQSSKLAVHATLLTSLAAHRQRAAATGVDELRPGTAYTQVVRYIPALIQDAAVTAAEAAATAYLADVRNGADADAAVKSAAAARARQGHNSANTPAQRDAQPRERTRTARRRGASHSSESTTAFAAQGKADASKAACGPEVQCPPREAASSSYSALYPNTSASSRSAQAQEKGERDALQSAHAAAFRTDNSSARSTPDNPSGPASDKSSLMRINTDGRRAPIDLIGAALAPAYVDRRLSSTRMLERFRNHVGIAALLRAGYGEVLDMYEDRCASGCAFACSHVDV